METIIGLLFILLPVIFKLIGRKLEKSGQTEKAGKVRELAKTLGADDDSEKDAFEEWLESLKEPEAEPQQPEPAALPQMVEAKPQPVFVKEDMKRTTVRSMLKEDEPEKKKDKIDPKKLVIYSEIMKPKYK